MSKIKSILDEYDSKILDNLVQSKNKIAITQYLENFGLEIRENKIYPKKEYIADWKMAFEYWDKRQLVKKILLNSAYGSLLNEYSRFYDKRIGQSTTLSGRQIVKHMMCKINELITDEYKIDGDAIVYGDTDSELGSTLHNTTWGVISVEEMFDRCHTKWEIGDKEYASDNDLMVMSYDESTNLPNFGHINYIYRHKVSKSLYEIQDEFDNVITVTEDHSVMVERNEKLIEVTPLDFLDSDILISLDDKKCQTFGGSVRKGKVKSAKKIRKAENEYVYDIGMQNEANPWYFGNNILIHNSCFFSAYPMLKDQIDLGEIAWTKEMCIELYDNIADQTNESFPAFMEGAFHVPQKNGKIIKAGRELIGDRALFIAKKRYAINIFDKEGKRKDIGGAAGDVKAMGLDLKRADTPKYVQEFLMEILVMVLAGAGREETLEKIRAFKTFLSQQLSWTKGSPKSVNNLTYYGNLETNSKKGKETMPGHVRASLNYNYLRKMNGDNYSQQIIDGMKIIVCKLCPNALGFTSIAYPTDEVRLPQWFTSLPFDDEAMENILVDDKIANLIGVLNWNVSHELNVKTTFNNLFKIG